jgi:hypothetical protein
MNLMNDAATSAADLSELSHAELVDVYRHFSPLAATHAEEVADCAYALLLGRGFSPAQVSTMVRLRERTAA